MDATDHASSTDRLARSARLARSIVAAGSHVVVGVPGMTRVLPSHLVTTSGSLLAPAASIAGGCLDRALGGRLSPVLDLWASDVSDVPQRDRLRGVVHLRGRVGLVDGVLQRPESWDPDEAVLAFVPEVVVLREHHPGAAAESAVALPLEDYRAASPDPLIGWEGEWLAHLDRDHSAALRGLLRKETRVDTGDEVRVLRADREGLTFRVYRDDDVSDVLVRFPTPVRCGCEAVAALNSMLGVRRSVE